MNFMLTRFPTLALTLSLYVVEMSLGWVVLKMKFFCTKRDIKLKDIFSETVCYVMEKCNLS